MGGYRSTRWNGVPTRPTVEDRARVTVADIRAGRVPRSLTPRLEGIRQPFGGKRWFLLCPACGVRCRVLYGDCASWLTGHFACRMCHDLAYSCQREVREMRLRRRAARCLKRVSTLGRARRKGVHQRTWAACVGASEAFEIQADEEWMASAARWLEKYQPEASSVA